MTLSPQWLDELRSRTTLSALIGRSIKVTKAGREFKACCPFHNEKTPSFTINDEKGFYHCFGCSAHGDAIRWMTDQRGLGFVDAVKELADAAGMQVPAPDPQAAKRAEKANSLYDVMAAAQDFFQSKLGNIDGNQARDYLEKRGLSAKTSADFGMGYSPDSRTALRDALKQFGDDMLIEAGLLIKVDDKEPYDRFRGRLMIPIRDARGRVIAFGGRILDAGEPKYLNSPDTPLFDKGRTLYNLDKASPASRASNRVVVVEGYMDVIALAQAGFADAVAPLGTALTEQQIVMLWRMVPKPILCFDGDNAGQKAAMRAAQRALGGLKPGHSLDFATLPAGQDPDDLVRASGPRAFADLIAKPQPLVDRLWQYELAAAPVQTPEDRAGFKQRLGTHISAISDGEIRQHYSAAFRERFDVFFAAPPRKQSEKRSFNPRFGKQTPAPLSREARNIGKDGTALLANHILASLFQQPKLIQQYRETLIELNLQDQRLSAMLDALLYAKIGKEGLDRQALHTILGPDLYNMADDLLRGDHLPLGSKRDKSGEAELNPDAEANIKLFTTALRLLRLRPKLDEALATATKKASSDLTDENFAEQQRLRREKEDFDRQIAALVQREAD